MYLCYLIQRLGSSCHLFDSIAFKPERKEWRWEFKHIYLEPEFVDLGQQPLSLQTYLMQEGTRGGFENVCSVSEWTYMLTGA